MAMILDAFMSKCCTLLADSVHEEVIMVLGVKDELRKLLRKMNRIRAILNDAEKRKINKESPIDNWLSELKDVMYDVDDMIDLCRIKGAQLLADQSFRSEPSRVCYNFSSTFLSYFTSIPLRHEIGNKIKEINDRLNVIKENKKQFKLEKSEILETPQVTSVNPRQTSSMVDPLVVGGEVEVATNELVNLLIAEKGEEKCRLFAVAGMGGIGKTTLAQKIYNHPKIHTYFTLKAWVCVSQTYSETALLKQVIREAKGKYGDADTKSELQNILRDCVDPGQNLFLVLDNVWRADVWLDLFRIPLQTTNSSVRVLVTTRYENVAKVMKAECTRNVMKLSIESSWDMLRRLLFSDGEEQSANELKELGINIVERCGGLPLSIKAIAGVLDTRERTRKEWQKILRSDAWSVSNLHENHIAALHLSYEDLPSHLKQCFLYFSLYREESFLDKCKFVQLWVAEGLITGNKENFLIEDVAVTYFNQLIERNLLVSCDSSEHSSVYKIHDIVRSLALFLSKEETSYGDVNLNNSITFTKVRRLSIEHKKAAEVTEILDSVANQGALRTLLASNSDLLLDDERLKLLSCLRVLDISHTEMKNLPDSIETLVHLRYLNLSYTSITTIPESIKHLAYLQFLKIDECKNLTSLPNGITQLHNLRYLDLHGTSISFMPKGIEKLQQLNYLNSFPMANNDTSSKLEELNSLKQIRILTICKLDGAQRRDIILKELPELSNLGLHFSLYRTDPDEEKKLAVEELFDKIIPPKSLEEFKIYHFFGRRFPNWMTMSSFENHVPNLTILVLGRIPSCTQLPPLGQLPQLRELNIYEAIKVKTIGPEFLGWDNNSTTRIAFPKLKTLLITGMDELQDWSFGAQVEENASPRLMLLPCLHNLSIWTCPLLRHLPKGLKYSALKSLEIEFANSLKSVDNLPAEIEELRLRDNKNLEKVYCCLPMLKQLSISGCDALSSVEKFDSLQKLIFYNSSLDSLSDWLLMLLQQRGQQSNTNEDFLLDLTCSKKAFQGCLKGGFYWDIIKHIPRVIARDFYGSYLHYDKQPYLYDAKICDSVEYYFE